MINAMPQTPAQEGNPSEAACWQAVIERDRGSDGRFVYGVVTTGVYCKPSCGARRPNRHNVRFFATPAEAEVAGLRPCKRCRPLGRDAAGADPVITQVTALCEHIRRECDGGEPLDLGHLARHAGLRPAELRRRFQSVLGLTPRAYVEACRLAVLKRQLRHGESVTNAIYDAGFGSLSRVYERVDSHLGMTPAQYRAGGRELVIHWACLDTRLGPLLVAGTERGLCSVQFGDSRENLQQALAAEFPAAQLVAVEAPFSAPLGAWVEALDRHLRGTQPELDLPLDIRATAFQQKVWAYLRSIPYGARRSYTEVAAAIGQPTAVRAVATACASNHVALVIPCHRVLRGDGNLAGYRWGLERKRSLLATEQAVQTTAQPTA